MKRLFHFLLLIIAVLATPTTEAVDSGWGLWEGGAHEITYSFLRNNELKLWGQHGSAEKMEGVWKSGGAICWLGEKKQQEGNLMLYVDSLQCCMSAQFLGNKLILTEVWQKGGDKLGACTNRVLNRAKETPDQRIAREQAEIEREGARQQRMHAELMREQAKKDAAEKHASELRQAQDAKICPDVYAQYKKIENTFDKPMLWQGCDEERKRIETELYTIEQRHEQTAKDCPDVYARYKAMKRKYDRPQLWIGCTGAYH